jgi:hypothetical protein
MTASYDSAAFAYRDRTNFHDAIALSNFQTALQIKKQMWYNMNH